MVMVGGATVTPVYEVDAGEIIQGAIPSATPEAVLEIDWLHPHYANNDGTLNAHVQAFLVEVGGVKIVVDDHMGFAESVLPVHEADMAELVADNHHVTPEVSFVPTPGHTPGHVAIRINSGGETAIIAGDVLEHPCQAAHPDWGTPFDNNTEQANETRRKLLDHCAETGAVLIGSHFVEPFAGKIARSGTGFELVSA